MTKTITSFDALIDLSDRATFEQEVGVSQQLVTRAKANGLLPARWYREVRDYCRKRDAEPSDELFQWVHGHTKQNVKGSAPVQEVARNSTGGAA